MTQLDAKICNQKLIQEIHKNEEAVRMLKSINGKLFSAGKTLDKVNALVDSVNRGNMSLEDFFKGVQDTMKAFSSVSSEGRGGKDE